MATLNPLETGWAFWYIKRAQSARTPENYEKNIKKICEFNTVEQFFSYYNHLFRPHELPIGSELHLFREGIKPLWEDDNNKAGGKWVIRVKKGLGSKCWEDLVFALIGEQIQVGDEICGIVISVRYQEDIISVWNKTAVDKEAKTKIIEGIRNVFSYIPNLQTDYKFHDASMRDSAKYKDKEGLDEALEPVTTNV